MVSTAVKKRKKKKPTALSQAAASAASATAVKKRKKKKPTAPFERQVPHIPKANSNCSDRIRAMSMVGNSDKKSRNAGQKNQTLNDNLFPVEAVDKKYHVNEQTIHDEMVFVDGGKVGNPPIDPPSRGGKKVRVMKVNELYIAGQHLKPKHRDKGKGLRHRRPDKTMVFTLCPRVDALKAVGVLDDPTVPTKLVESYTMSIAAAHSTLKRGKNITIESDADSFKYICVGSSALRGAKGLNDLHYVLTKMPHDHQERIRKHIVAVEEDLFQRFLESSKIRQVTGAVQFSGVPLFTTTSGATTSIYSSFACGKNVFLSAHIDRDFTFSAVMIVAEGDLEETVCYFCFPVIGIAVPMRPFDVLFFDPSEPHHVSSRCDNERDILCLSFYLKSNLLGGNDNDKKISKKERGYLAKFIQNQCMTK